MSVATSTSPSHLTNRLCCDAGTVYEIKQVFNFNTYNGMPQASATRACVEDRTSPPSTSMPGNEQNATRDRSSSPSSRPPSESNVLDLQEQPSPASAEGKPRHTKDSAALVTSRSDYAPSPAQVDSTSMASPTKPAQQAKQQDRDTEPPTKRPRVTRHSTATSAKENKAM